MQVFIAGGTGIVGTRAVPAIIAAGHDVTVVSRSDTKDRVVRSMGAEPVRVDLFDRDAVRRAVEGHQAVVNLATNIPPMTRAARAKAWETNDRLRIEASRHLADAAVEHGALRFVQESITFPYEDAGATWIDESHPTSHADFTVGADAAETSAASVTQRAGVGVVLRFAQFYAPDSSHTRTFFAMARRGISPFPGSADAYASFVHADDAGSAVARALDAPAGTYNVSEDEPLTRGELDRLLAELVGRKKSTLRRLPPRLVLVANRAADVLMRSQRVSNRAFRTATGWAPVYAPEAGWASVVGRMEAVR